MPQHERKYLSQLQNQPKDGSFLHKLTSMVCFAGFQALVSYSGWIPGKQA